MAIAKQKRYTTMIENVLYFAPRKSSRQNKLKKLLKVEKELRENFSLLEADGRGTPPPLSN